jgi:hypothetical protein
LDKQKKVINGIILKRGWRTHEIFRSIQEIGQGYNTTIIIPDKKVNHPVFPKIENRLDQFLFDAYYQLLKIQRIICFS